MAERGGKPAHLFKVGEIVSLKIHRKYRLPGESVRLPCRIIHIRNGLFRLLSAHGILDKYHQGANLNVLYGFSNSIALVPTNTETITIPKAYMRKYMKPSIAELQPKGQKKKASKEAKTSKAVKTKAKALAKTVKLAKTKAKGKWKAGDNEPFGM
jgi:hypothetical protein